jgi:DHA2 family multidrug resistance protein
MWMYRNLDPNTSTWGVLAPTLVRGVGLGLLVTPVMTAAINAVPTPKAGMASSMLNLIQQVAGSVGIATLATVLGHRTVFHQGLVGEAMRPDSPGWHAAVGAVGQRLLDLGVAPGDAGIAAAATVGRHAAMAASVAAFDDAFLVGAGVVLLGVVPALFLGRAGKAHAVSTAEALAE